MSVPTSRRVQTAQPWSLLVTTRASPCLPAGFPRSPVKSLPDGGGLLVPGRRAHGQGSSFLGAGRHGAPNLRMPAFPPKMPSPVRASLLRFLRAPGGKSKTVSWHISSPAHSGTSGQTDSPLCLIIKPCCAPAVCTCQRERGPPCPISISLATWKGCVPCQPLGKSCMAATVRRPYSPVFQLRIFDDSTEP